jgi:hypothetical protein
MINMKFAPKHVNCLWVLEGQSGGTRNDGSKGKTRELGERSPHIRKACFGLRKLSLNINSGF